LAIDRANNFLAPRPAEIVSESRSVRVIPIRAFDDGLHRDLMRWENEGGRIETADHKIHEGGGL
jgi:hypothetical protein